MKVSLRQYTSRPLLRTDQKWCSDEEMVTTRATKRKEEEECRETEITQEREEWLTHGLKDQG